MFKLGELTAPMRWVVTMTLLVLAAGYGVGLLNIHFTYSAADGEPGLSAADLIRTLSAQRGRTLLAAKIDGGSMEQFLPDPLEKARILNWIQDGASPEGFERVVKPILARNCVVCHNPEGLMYMQPLDRFEAVANVVRIDRGEPIPIWARVAHTHLQSIALIFFVVGMVFTGTSLPERWKSLLAATPFVALAVDFGARFLARYDPLFVYVMMAAGAVAGMTFGTMVAIALYQMWIRR
jgi:hypothetical protein